MKKIKIDEGWILSGVFVILFLIWTILVLKGVFSQFDYQIFDFLHKYLLNDSLLSFLKMITYLGSASVLAVIVLSTFLIFKNKYIGISLGLNAFFISVFNLILKNIFFVTRPSTTTFIIESGYSYPSGHAMVSFAFYGLMIYFLFKKMKPSFLRNVLIFLLVLGIILVGFSRIYLGVHHFSDIIGGYLISFAYLILYIKLIKKLGMVK